MEGEGIDRKHPEMKHTLEIKKKKDYQGAVNNEFQVSEFYEKWGWIRKEFSSRKLLNLHTRCVSS